MTGNRPEMIIQGNVAPLKTMIEGTWAALEERGFPLRATCEGELPVAVAAALDVLIEHCADLQREVQRFREAQDW